MNLENYISFLLILTFIVPGFIFDSITRKLIPKTRNDTQSSFLIYLTSSIINYGLWIWLIFWIDSTEYYISNPGWTGFIWFLIIFVSPSVLGLTWGLLNKFDVTKDIINYFRIQSINPIPTGWDYKFCNISSPIWILITLNNGDLVGGYFGSNSFASSETNHRDIFIEKVYKINSDRPWSLEKENNDGILISQDQIRTIEFFKN